MNKSINYAGNDEETKNIFVSGFDGGDDVMIFSKTLTVEKVIERLKAKGKSFIEVYEVPTDDLGYYLYEPCWIEVKK